MDSIKIKRLVVLADLFEEKVAAENNDGYGGRGSFELPPNHKALVVLTSGTFSCANCEYVNAEKHECNNSHYIKWNGSKKLPDAPLDKICSDWFESKMKKCLEHPHKNRYNTRKDAETAILLSDKAGLQIYHCETCGGWHLTSSSKKLRNEK